MSDTGREIDLLGGMTQQEVADKLAKENVVIHAIVPGNRFSQFAQIVATTGGTLHSKGNNQGNGIGPALDKISAQLITGPQKFVAQVGVDSTDRYQTSISVDATASGLDIEEMDVTTQQGARNAIQQVDVATERVSQFRTVYGAETNRLREMHKGNENMQINEAASRSRIEDTDYAEATAAFARTQVLQNAAVSVLTQVGQVTSEVALALLR